jgi:TPR repeat protein
MYKEVLILCVGVLGPISAHATSHGVIEPSTSSFQNGINSLENGKYNDAFQIFEGLASTGDAAAQYNLSLLFLKGVGIPTNYKSALYWAWQSHINGYEEAFSQVEDILEIVPEAVRVEVANETIDDLLTTARSGSQDATLDLTETYLELLNEPDFEQAYTWALIAQAYGLLDVADFLEKAGAELEIETKITQQAIASELFLGIRK